jgi:hypothetical protein
VHVKHHLGNEFSKNGALFHVNPIIISIIKINSKMPVSLSSFR